MYKTKENSLYEVQGKTRDQGETYHNTNCAMCGAPLVVMVQRGQNYVEKDRYCSDECKEAGALDEWQAETQATRAGDEPR